MATRPSVRDDTPAHSGRDFEGHVIVVFLFQLGDGAGLGPLEPWHAEEFAAAVDHARDHLAPWIPFAHTVTDVEKANDLSLIHI